MNAVQKLRQMVAEVQKPGSAAGESWALVGRLLSRMPVDHAEAERVVAGRDTAGLEALVHRLEHPGAAAPVAGAPAVDEHEMDRALKAFKKRLKLVRLEDESKLAGRRLTSGRTSEIHAILPPHEFGAEVWRALAQAGKLKDEGRGFYALAEGGTSGHGH